MINTDVKALIREAVNAGLHAGRNEMKNVQKDTEKRLYAYPILLKRIEKNKAELRELQKGNMPEKSKDIVRFRRSGQRLTAEDILSVLIQDLTATIAADEHEAAIIAGALETINDDPYYAVIEERFLHGKNDDDVAEAMHCDPSTVRRNRTRLIGKLAVWLYGAAAL